MEMAGGTRVIRQGTVGGQRSQEGPFGERVSAGPLRMVGMTGPRKGRALSGWSREDGNEERACIQKQRGQVSPAQRKQCVHLFSQ